MPSVECPECGNPRIDVIYFDRLWTGKCQYCKGIITADKEEVSWDE